MVIALPTSLFLYPSLKDEISRVICQTTIFYESLQLLSRLIEFSDLFQHEDGPLESPAKTCRKHVGLQYGKNDQKPFFYKPSLIFRYTLW